MSGWLVIIFGLGVEVHHITARQRRDDALGLTHRLAEQGVSIAPDLSVG